MNTRSLTDRILLTGAVGITLTAVAGVILAVTGLLRRAHEWRSWALRDPMDAWTGLPVAVLSFLVLLALSAWACLRLIRRRNVLRSLSENAPCPLTPRSKYAVWSDDWRSAGRPAAFGALRTRKKVRRSPAPRPPFVAPASATSAAPLPQTVARR